MIQTGFYLGDGAWWVMANFDIATTKDLSDVYRALMSVGCPDYKVREICMVLSRPDNGYTYTDYDGRFSLMFASKGTSVDELYDTIDHEKKHVIEHISTYFDVDPKSEDAAYLAGELGKQLFPAIAMAVCPRCHHE